MPNVPGYTPVKEYAEKRGISLQAVYKQIRAGRLDYTEVMENGRPVKYVKADAAAADPERTAPDVSNLDTAAPEPQPDDPLRVALDLLGEQLREKDKQIERLQAEIKEKNEHIREQDAHIREQAETLTELLRNSQQLQAHAQHLLEQHEEEPPEPVLDIQDAAEVHPDQETAEETPKKRRGFWAWLLGE